MAKSKETWNKKQNEKNRIKKREDKERRKEERKANAAAGAGSMIAYVDEFGNLSDTPPDPEKKTKVIAENIDIRVPKRESLPPVDTERKGTITFFNESKGYGFIKDAETQQSIFTHVNDHVEQVRENDRVTFKIMHNAKGANAVEVKLLAAK